MTRCCSAPQCRSMLQGHSYLRRLSHNPRTPFHGKTERAIKNDIGKEEHCELNTARKYTRVTRSVPLIVSRTICIVAARPDLHALDRDTRETMTTVCFRLRAGLATLAACELQGMLVHVPSTTSGVCQWGLQTRSLRFKGGRYARKPQI